MRLLLVEDDAAVRESMLDVLTELAEVQAVDSVAEAVAALTREPFALALTDLHLDAWGGARQVLAAARRVLVPVAVVSAAPTAEVTTVLEPESPDARLAKPFDIDELLALADHFLGLWRDLDARGEPFELRPGLPLPVRAAGVVQVESGELQVEGRPFARGYLTRRQLASVGVDAAGRLRYVADLR